MGVRPPAPARSLGRPDGAARRAAAQLEPGRRIGGAPRAQPADRSSTRRSAGPAPAAGAPSTARTLELDDVTGACRQRNRQRSMMPSNIVVPEVGESIVDARVAKWLKQGRRRRRRRRPARRARDRQDRPRGGGAAGRRAQPHRAQDGADVKIGEVLGDRSTKPGGGGRRRQPRHAERGGRSAGGGSRRQRRARPRATPSRAQGGGAERRRPVASVPRQRRRRPRHAPRRREGGRAGTEPRRNGRHAAAAAASSAAAPRRAKPPAPVAEDRRRADGDRTEERVRMSKRRATIAKRLVEAQRPRRCSRPSTRST